MADLLERLSSALGDRYAIQSEVGRGGMAVVFLAEDLKHRRKVAIKVLHPELSVTLAAERFLSEIQIVAGLNHPHILMLIDSGEADGLLYYVMPYVNGESLRHRLEREGQLPVEEAVRIAVEVADGLQYAHEQGVIHRDIKPGNILLAGKHAVLADFGIARAITVAQGARVTSTGLGVGTPLYASPEQATGAETLDGRTDIYSLGCVLYEMLAGEVPLTATTPQAVQARRMTETPAPIHAQRDTVPPLLDGVIAKALARLPADRWESAEKFGQALLTATMDATPVARLDLATTPGLEVIAARGRPKPGRRMTVTAMGVVAVATVAWLLVRPSTLTLGGSKTPPNGSYARETKLELQGTFGEAFGFRSGSYAISPDGQYLAYCSRHDAEAVHRLWLMDLSRPERAHRALASGQLCRWVEWTPSGDEVLFEAEIAGRYGYYRVAVDGGSASPFIDCTTFDSAGNWIVDPRHSRISPDGSRTAFTTRWGINVVETGSCDFAHGDSILVPHDDVLWLWSWSPDGNRLVFEKGDTLWTGAADGTGLQAVYTGRMFWPVSWLHPGNTLYVGGGRGGIMRLQLPESGAPEGAPVPLAHFEQEPIDHFSLSSDGRRAVVARQTPSRFRLVRVLADPGLGPPAAMVIPVTDTVRGYGAFAVSHDGGWVAFGQRSGGESDLFKVPLEGGNPQRLTHSGDVDIAEWPTWSPDGRFIAYSGTWRDTLRLWLVTTDGRSTGFVANVITNSENPGLSWGGSTLFYARHDYRTEMMWNLEIEYGQWMGNAWRPSPTGAESGTFVVRGDHQLLTDTLRWGPSMLPFASPDGSSVVFHALSKELGSYMFVFSSRDSSYTPVMSSSSGEYPLGWTENGDALYTRSGHDVYIWPLDGGQKQLVLTLPSEYVWINSRPDTGADCQPRRGMDHLEFICAIDETRVDLFLVENFDPQVN